MNIIDKNTFFDITQNFDFVPFMQSEGWWAMNSVKDENRFVFFVDSLKKPTLACMGCVIKRFGLKLLLIDGECFADAQQISDKKVRDFYKDIKQTGFDMVEVNSSLPYNALYEIGIREAGYLRPVGMFSTPLSSWVYLQQKIYYNRNWERNIKKSEKYSLELKIIAEPTEKDYKDFCEIYNLMSNRKNINKLSTQQISRLLISKNFQILFVEKNNERIAAIIIYFNKNQAISEGIFAGSTDKALATHATFFMYDAMFQYLKKLNYEIYDMAKLAPSTHSKQSVFLFKNGVKGEKILYCGEFSWYKRQIYRPMMYFVKKYLFKRIEV